MVPLLLWILGVPGLIIILLAPARRRPHLATPAVRPAGLAL